MRSVKLTVTLFALTLGCALSAPTTAMAAATMEMNRPYFALLHDKGESDTAREPSSKSSYKEDDGMTTSNPVNSEFRAFRDHHFD